ncbi:MAG: hypothetical protein MJ075_01600 [Oscillospiraceae bacterium]|nr:hypothetical protein [Oscillospiraceae bacterium]
MYQIGDVVLYSTDGVFRIHELAVKKIGRTKAKYYVLRSVYRESSVIYVPAGEGGLEDRMHPVLSREEVNSLLEDMPGCQWVWVENENERKLRCKEVLSGGDRRAVIGMIRALREHRIRQEAAGKKMHLSDERFLKEAERVLYDEIAHVMEIQPNDVVGMVAERLGIV